MIIKEIIGKKKNMGKENERKEIVCNIDNNYQPTNQPTNHPEKKKKKKKI